MLLGVVGGFAQCDNADDYTALRALYLSTDGDGWDDNTGWPTAATFNANPTPPGGTDMSGWYGITCGVTERVSEINLLGNLLSGNLPSEIGNLSELESLNLNANNLNGSIPTSLGSLTNLGSILFFQNSFSGLIPDQLNNLTNLIVLELADNDLSGPIPDLSNLNELSYLNISENPLNTSIPSTLGGLSSLTFLILDNCNLNGNLPMELGNLSNLTNLQLQNNSLSGCIPSELQNLCLNVTDGDISNNPSLWTQSWSDFCNNQEGICTNCPTEYLITYPSEVCEILPIQVEVFGGAPPYTVNLYEDNAPSVLLESVTTFTQIASFELFPFTGVYNYFATFESDLGVLCEDVTQLSGSEDVTVFGGGIVSLLLPSDPQCTETDFNITVSISGGAPPYQVDLLEGGLSVGALSGNGPDFIFTTSNSNVGNYFYGADIVDNLGCFFVSSPGSIWEVNIIQSPNINTLEPIVECQSNGEAVTFDLTDYNDSLSQGNTILWSLESDGTSPINNPTALIISSTVTVFAQAEAANLCFSEVVPVDIVLNQFTLTCSSIESAVDISTEDASLPLNISWDGPSSGSSESSSSSYTITDLEDGLYDITVEDNLGCIETCTVEIITTPTVCDHPDVPNLIALYSSTNGVGWMNDTGWTEGAEGTNCDPCGEVDDNASPWYGISCVGNRVTEIQLGSNELEGEMILLSDIDSLEVIALNNNKISGGDWNFDNINLRSISIAFNDLKTTLPNFNLPNLEELICNNDSLIGALPELDSVPKLRSLYAYSNPFDSEIPDWQLDSLRGISFYNSNLDGNLPNLEKTIYLEEIYFDANNLVGEIPSYDNMSALNLIRLNNNNLMGCMSLDRYCSIDNFDFTANPMLAEGGISTSQCIGFEEDGANCDEGIGLFNTETCSCLCNSAIVDAVVTIDISDSPLTSSMIMTSGAFCTLYFDSAIQDTILNLDCDQANTTLPVFVYSESGQQVWFDLIVTDVDDICGNTNEMLPFVITWVTNNSGITGDSSIRVPTFPGETYNYEVDWDYIMGELFVADTSGIVGDFEYNFGREDTVTIAIRGEFPRIYFNDTFNNWVDDSDKIIYISQWGEIQWLSMESAFEGCANLNSVAIDNPDLSEVADMERMFSGASIFNGEISDWDVSNVVNMIQMFRRTKSFNRDIGSWDVSNVIDMSGMFALAEKFNQDISSWDVSNVIDLSGMFGLALDFNQNINTKVINASTNNEYTAWDVSKVVNMSQMFYSAEHFDQSLENWNVSNVTRMSGMFFNAGEFDQDISNWNVSKVTDMGSMFHLSSKFNQDISKWDVSNVSDFYVMFLGAISFNQDLGSWNLNSAENFNIVVSDDTSGVFSNSGLSCENYSSILNGWANNPNTPDSLEMQAFGIEYNDLGNEGRDALLTKGWDITGDIYEPLCNTTLECEIVSIQNTCTSNLDGQIIVNIGSAESCTFQWFTSSGIEVSTDINLLGVTPGVYDFNAVCNGDTICKLQAEVLELELSVEINSTNLCNSIQDTISTEDIYASYSWTFEGMEVGTENELIVSQEGIYSLMVSDQFGCTATATTTVSNFTSPETGILTTTFERCNNQNNGETILNLESLTNASGIWTTNSMIDISDLTAVDFDGAAAEDYVFTFTTNTAQEPCTDSSTTITVNVSTCSECSCIQVNPPVWINVSDLSDVTISCEEDMPTAVDLDFTNAPDTECLISGSVMTTIDSSGFDGCKGDIIYRWQYLVCEQVLDTSRLITVLPYGNLVFDITPTAMIEIACDEIDLYNIALDYMLDTGMDCIPSGEVNPVIIENYNECGGTVTYTWSVDDPCSDLLTFTQVATIAANDDFQFLQLPEDITLSCNQLPFEPAILMVSNNADGICAVSQQVIPISVPNTQNCPGTIVNTWTFTHPCTGEIIELVQTITFMDCDIPMLTDDYKEVRSNVIVDMDIFTNDYLPEEAFIEILDFEDDNFRSYEIDDFDNFRFLLRDPFFDTIRIQYAVCDTIAQCMICDTATIKIVDEALKDIFLTDIITPDGDGMNDALRFNFEADISDAHLYIFNRWGSKIYEKIGYTNDWDASGYPGGVYYYVLRIGKAEVKKTLTVVK